MHHARPSAPLPPSSAADAAVSPAVVRSNRRRRVSWRRDSRGVTLVEVMVSLFILASVMLGFITAAIQSRRNTEANVLQAAATSMIYGIIEQIKQTNYSTRLPATESDSNAKYSDGTLVPAPFIRVRINQKTIVWLRTVYTPVTDEDTSTTLIPPPQGPSAIPSVDATAADLGAIDNYLGDIPLSNLTGTTAQKINLNLWVWVDGMSDLDHDVADAKKVTVVYTYSYIDGRATRTVRNSEVFVRCLFEE